MKELTRIQLFQPRIITNNGGSVSCAFQYLHNNIAIATATIAIVNDIPCNDISILVLLFTQCINPFTKYNIAKYRVFIKMFLKHLFLP